MSEEGGTPRYVIWAIGAGSMAEALLQFIDYWMDGDAPKARLWLVGALVILALALVVEKVKTLREGLG